jgi:hypothetical protein
MVEKFSRPSGDAAYQDWLTAHRDGYVVNIGRSGRSGHALLHRATCRTIRVLSGQQSTFVDQWVKWCSTSEAELQERVTESRGAPAERCKARGVACWL